MKSTAIISLVMLISSVAWGYPGMIVLQNGHVLKGDISTLKGGGYWIVMKNGAIKVEKEEIRKLSLNTNKDKVQERFEYTFRNTPARSERAKLTTNPYENIINREARNNRVDPALVKAVIKAESNFNPRDRSSKGACGLMQLMPGTANVLGVKKIFSPDENIRGGVRFLRDMIEQFGGDTEMALAAYNAGPGAVKKYHNIIPPYRETHDYVNNVSRYYRQYRQTGEIYTFTDDKGCLNVYNIR